MGEPGKGEDRVDDKKVKRRANIGWKKRERGGYDYGCLWKERFKGGYDCGSVGKGKEVRED